MGRRGCTMSTRGVFVFADAVTATVRDKQAYCVYVHHDTYPEGGATYLAACLQGGWTWPLPRYEADEFAAGFVASIKGNRLAAWKARGEPCDPLPYTPAAGGVYLSKRWDAVGNIEWAYLVRPADERCQSLHLTLCPVDWASETLADGLALGAPEYCGPLADFLAEHGHTMEGADAPGGAA